MRTRRETAFVSRMSEFPSRRTDHSPLEIRAPGTEFLDAETGGQKLTQETANVWGDRKTGTTPANIPAETAYLESVWKPVVRSDWMVVCAVIYEPVSLLLANIRVISEKNSERITKSPRSARGPVVFHFLGKFEYREKQ